jgi:murein DD-endopeptidase MepM/ murein hydrolase activator NlpD
MKKEIIFIGFLSTILLGSITLIHRQIVNNLSQTECIDNQNNDQQDEAEQAVYKEYGIVVDSFDVVCCKFKRNENLASILTEKGVSVDQIRHIASTPKEVFDIRKIRAGNTYKLFMDKDSCNTLRYFVYEHNPADYVLIHFQDSVHIEKKRKDIDTVKKSTYGIIESSLWETLVSNKINPQLAIELSEIYAWTIDFFRITEGDNFKVIYEEEFVDTISLGISKIEAASFQHAGETYYAIPFIQDSALSYYDSAGNSLKREFLKSPLHYKYISSGYSNSRFHPVLKIWRPHRGIDYAAAYGTPVRSVGDGTVILAAYSRGAGRYIKIRHNSVYTTAYLHLSRFNKGIYKGARVKQGTIIGYVGSTGLSTGPHLDFRFWKNGYPVNPLHVKAPPVEPIKPENKYAYDSVRHKMIDKLAQIKSPQEDDAPQQRYQAFKYE